jgi:endothelin-converting enzyme/putative endopeptidase
VRTRGDLVALFATPGYIAPVGVGITPDPSDPTRYVAAAGQGGLGMPNRDYYLKEGADYDRYRAEYRNFIIELHRLAGIPNGAAKADAIIALEKQIATAHWAPERLRDPTAIYNPKNRQQLAEMAPQLDWVTYLNKRGLGNLETVIATTPSAFTEIGKLLEAVPIDTWKDYMSFHFIRSYASYLPKAFDDAQFNFYGKTLAASSSSASAGSAASRCSTAIWARRSGQIYVPAPLPGENRRQMDELIVNLRGAFAERLQKLDWMDDETRAEALKKLTAFEPRIGTRSSGSTTASSRSTPPIRSAMRCARANSSGICSCRACPTRSTARCGG